MTIEERLLKKYGETREPEFATWMLRDGTMVNGTIEGRQRDIDHREIGEFYKPSKFQEPGSMYCYIEKFMRRGNIRMCCNEFGYNFEMWGVPSERQIAMMRTIDYMAAQAGVERRFEWHTRNSSRYHPRSGSFADFVKYLRRYTGIII